MDFLDDAKLEQARQAKAAEERQLKYQEWSKIVIPDDMAIKIADDIYSLMKNKLLIGIKQKTLRVMSASKFFYGSGNYWYEIGLPGNDRRSDGSVRIEQYDHVTDLSNCSFYQNPDGFFCLNISRGTLYYRNDESLVKVFTLLISKFKKQNIKYIYRYQYLSDEIRLIFCVIIPCDKDGNITA